MTEPRHFLHEQPLIKIWKTCHSALTIKDYVQGVPSNMGNFISYNIISCVALPNLNFSGPCLLVPWYWWRQCSIWYFVVDQIIMRVEAENKLKTSTAFSSMLPLGWQSHEHRAHRGIFSHLRVTKFWMWQPIKRGKLKK